MFVSLLITFLLSYPDARAFLVVAAAPRTTTTEPKRDGEAYRQHQNLDKRSVGVSQRADEWKPDLVIIGSQGRSAVGRLLLGSVSKKLVTDSKSSVRVVRRAANLGHDHVTPKIIVGVDGSTAAEEAVRTVGSRVWPTGTEVRLVAVDDRSSPTATGLTEALNDELAVAARKMVEWAESELSASPINSRQNSFTFCSR